MTGADLPPHPAPRSDGGGFRTVARGGEYVRVADPEWADPLSAESARVRGGRWNAPGAFPVVYLNGDVRVARATVLHRFAELPYGPEDLEPSAAPVLVVALVPTADHLDVVSPAGCRAAGLPPTYPLRADGRTVGHEACHPIGFAAWAAGLPGIACRSAAPGAPPGGEELAWFGRGERLVSLGIRTFSDWY